MKNMNRIELKKFTKKYFPLYCNDIKRVTYVVYSDGIEYLINSHYILFIKETTGV